jgi:dihydrofolate synthase / folylpolyglutamate synthase
MMSHSTGNVPDPVAALYQIETRGILPGLERMGQACDRLGHPEQNLPAIQIAGTNGKGSVSTMLEGALRKNGYRTGLFTSPHIHRFTERIRVDGSEVPVAELKPHIHRVLSLTREVDPILLTFFEVTTLVALLVFQARGVDVAVLEVGLGGRLDATSVVTPGVGVITSIGLDHTEWLGDTLTEIAFEKAAIAKANMTVCCGPVSDEVGRVIAETVQRRGAQLLRVTQPIQLPDSAAIPEISLQRHQQYNAQLALEAFCQFTRGKDRARQTRCFIESLQSFRMPCRFERLRMDEGEFLIDGAHNEEAMSALVTSIDRGKIPVTRIVFGALSGKPIERMLTLLKMVCTDIVIVSAPVERTMDAASVSRRWQLPHGTLPEVLSARHECGVTLVTGSFFVAAEARRILLGILPEPQIAM